MDGARRAALALHGLQPPDRDWILAQLSPGEREPLDGMLRELGELGFVPAAAPATRPEPQVAEARTPATALERLRAASPRRVAAALRGESPGAVAALLAIEPWPWRSRVLARRWRDRRAIAAAQPRAATAPRLAAALVELLDARLGNPPIPLRERVRAACAALIGRLRRHTPRRP